MASLAQHIEARNDGDLLARFVAAVAGVNPAAVTDTQIAAAVAAVRG